MSRRCETPEASGQETEIVYVPGAENHYKYDHDVIVLDERLKAYPKAHEYIKNHELEHARHGKPENRGFLELIRLELRTDIDHYFSDSDVLEEVHEYFEEKRERERLPPKTSLKFAFADLLRGVWDAAFRPLSWMCRRIQ